MSKALADELREAIVERIEHHGREAARLAQQVTRERLQWTQERIAWHRVEAEALASILARVTKD